MTTLTAEQLGLTETSLRIVEREIRIARLQCDKAAREYESAQDYIAQLTDIWHDLNADIEQCKS